jgi:hypothetical protein
MDRELVSLQGRAGSALSVGLGERLRACSSPPLPSADGVVPVAVNRALARFIAEKLPKLLS